LIWLVVPTFSPLVQLIFLKTTQLLQVLVAT